MSLCFLKPTITPTPWSCFSHFMFDDKVLWFRMLYFSPLIVLLCNLAWSAAGFTAGFTVAGFLPIPASCSVSLKSRKLSLAYASDPGYCVAWKGGAGFDECSYSALLKADCPSKTPICALMAATDVGSCRRKMLYPDLMRSNRVLLECQPNLWRRGIVSVRT